MAKASKNRTQKKQTESGLSRFNIDNIIPPKFHTLAAILAIVFLFLIFLAPMFFGGKTFQSGDIIASKSMVPYVENHKDGFTLWNPLIFCGMPAYSAGGVGLVWFNLIELIFGSIKSILGSFFSVPYAQWAFYLMILGISTFMLVKHLTKNTWISLLAGIASSFSTGIVVFLYIGHVTKLTSLCFYPLIFLILLRFQKKVKLIDSLVLIIALQLFLQGFHAQIIFYTLFAVAVYYIYYFIRFIIKKEKENRNNLLKSAGVFLVAIVIALLIQMDSITQIYEYTPYSTRGTKGILEKSAAKEDQSSSDFYDYHTQWSFSPGEVMTFIVPSWYGFGNSTYKGPLTNNQEQDVNTYFGQMSFVDVAVGYMGVLIFFLALIGVITRWKEPFVQFLTILSGIALLLSFGKTFPILFDLFFYHFPTFDKFRVPSMVLVILQLNIPILAGLGVWKIIQSKESNDLRFIKIFRNIAFVFTGILVLSLLLNSVISAWFIDRVNTYAATIQASNSQQAQYLTAFAEYTAGMFTGDLVIAFILLSAAFWGAYLYLNSKLSRDVFVLGLIIFVVIELWRIDARGEKFIDNPEINNIFDTPNYVNVIRKQNDKEPFRILNLKQDGSYGSFNRNTNYNAYFLLEDFYGYSGVKPRAYQDLMDVVGPVNETEWRMLNVKYIITNSPAQFPGFDMISQGEKEFVYRFNLVLPRAYFVNKIEHKGDLEVLNDMKANTFDPKNIAYVNGEKINVDAPDSTTYVRFADYKNEKISLDVNASGNNFLFLGDNYAVKGLTLPFISSEMWKAYIDGNKTEIHLVNHGFMGIVVPKGTHKVEFIYNPTSFVLSKYIALTLSTLVMAGVLLTIFVSLRKKRTTTV